MRAGRQLVRSTRKFATEERWRSWMHLASTVAIFCALIAVASLDLPWPVRLLASLLAALVHVRLFVIYHDYQHGAILQGSRAARALFWLYGLLAQAPPSVWKDTHDEHHRNNCRRLGLGSVGSYPVLTTDAYREAGLGVRFAYVVSRHPLTIALGSVTVFLWGFCIRPLLQNPRKHPDAALSLALVLSIVVGLGWARPDVLLFAVVLPWAVACAFGSYLFYAQHNFPEAKIRAEADWDYVFAALRSSSYIPMRPLLRWVTGNIGYHHVHHLNSRIPFYRLPEAMAELDDLQSAGTTSLRPRDILRCLRLKLWDPERDRFVSFREGRATPGSAAATPA